MIVLKSAKFISLTLLVCLCFTLGACKEKEPPHPNHTAYGSEIIYHAYVVEHPDKSKIEITAKQPQIDEEAKQTVEKWINGIWVPGTYRHTVRDFPNNYDTRIYYDDRNLQFGLDNESKLQFYFWGDNGGGDKIYTEQECLEIARRFLIPYQDISNYQLEITKEADQGLYRFTFTKYVGGYPSVDQAIVTVHESGKLYSYSSFMLGKVPDTVAEFEMAKLQKVITEKLDTLYAETKQHGDFNIIYGEPEIFYRTPGQLYCVVEVEHQCTHEGAPCSFADRIGLLVDI